MITNTRWPCGTQAADVSRITIPIPCFVVPSLYSTSMLFTSTRSPGKRQHFRKLAYLFDESQEERKNDYGYYGRGYKVTKEGFDEQAAYCKPYRDLRDDSTMWDCLEARSELLCAFLLQRSDLPMPEDVRFFAQVWVGMRATKALLNANEDRNTTVRGLDNPDLGLSQPWFVSVRTETLRDFLAAEVRFFEKAISMDDVPDPAREPKKIPRMDDDEGDDDSDVEDEDE